MKQATTSLRYSGTNRKFWLEPNNLTYLDAEFEEAAILQILVTVPANSQMVICHEVRSRESFSLQTMRNHSESPETRTAIAKLQILRNTQGILYPRMTHSGKCYVNIICFNDVGWFELWRVGVVSQASKFYFVKTRVYRARCYTDDTVELRCPTLEDKGDWPMLKEFLSEIFIKCKLAPTSPIDSSQKSDHDLRENLARVVWFNPFAGVGCLELPEGVMARIYWDRIANARGCKNLQPGEYVVYGKLNEPQGRTGFSYEVTGPALRLRRRPDEKEMKKRRSQLKRTPNSAPMKSLSPTIGAARASIREMLATKGAL